ncbi:efflux RND transporter permease subunit [Aminithiophilus ramosus]|uniref:Efflux RND transporter permease subunit n=1 Tax=Aminithiophilus ramosus TaxID=3029084 RepID=A0A9Q7EW66_9BACT|nr:efflux RND transporter permease subunit [Aminithiophilus ramosus]QTX32559.1 efflux RND transporter permease subunit [Aminithiophilus ramosus]
MTFTLSPPPALRLLPGMTGELAWTEDRGRGDLTVPADAVVADDGGVPTVFVFDPATSTVSRRPIDVGPCGGPDRLVVRGGLAELEGLRPLGMELEPIYGQNEIVVASIGQFVVNLLQSLAIVIGLLLLFMGWRSGLLIGFSLLLTLLGTFIGMFLMGVTLQKVSLGALILALGMLVDNAIVVVDGMLVRMARGEGPEEAACSVAAATQWPLLGATAVAILAFASIGLAPGNVGEFCRSLFQVMALSLFLSWVVALTAVPLLGVLFLAGPSASADGDPHDGPFLRLYRRCVQACLRRPRLLAGIVVVSLLGALAAFRNVPQSFFPPTTQPYFSLNIWKPQGTAIEETDRTVASVEAFLRDLPGVRNVASFVGEGALRYVLNYNYESPNSSYGQILVEVDEPIEKVIADAEAHLRRTLPDVEFSLVRVMTGPSRAYSLEIRLRGPDASLLKSLARRCEVLLRRHDDARDIGTDWRQPLFVLRPLLAEDRGRRCGVGRREVASALQWNFGGISVGLYREGDKLIPIVARPVEAERLSAEEIGNVQVWSDSQGGYLPLRQVVSSVETVWEDPLIRRRDGERTITVQANSVRGLAEPLRREIAPDVGALELPPGYSLEWGGEYLASKEAREPLGRIFPLCLAGMMLLLIGLFDSIRRALHRLPDGPSSRHRRRRRLPPHGAGLRLHGHPGVPGTFGDAHQKRHRPHRPDRDRKGRRQVDRGGPRRRVGEPSPSRRHGRRNDDSRHDSPREGSSLLRNGPDGHGGAPRRDLPHPRRRSRPLPPLLRRRNERVRPWARSLPERGGPMTKRTGESPKRASARGLFRVPGEARRRGLGGDVLGSPTGPRRTPSPMSDRDGGFPSGCHGSMGGGGVVAPGRLPDAALVRRRRGFAGRAEKRSREKIGDLIRRGVCA